MHVKAVYEVSGIRYELTVERDIEKWSDGRMCHTFSSLGKRTYGEKANLLEVLNQAGEVIWCQNCRE